MHDIQVNTFANRAFLHVYVSLYVTVFILQKQCGSNLAPLQIDDLYMFMFFFIFMFSCYIVVR